MLTKPRHIWFIWKWFPSKVKFQKLIGKLQINLDYTLPLFKQGYTKGDFYFLSKTESYLLRSKCIAFQGNNEIQRKNKNRKLF